MQTRMHAYSRSCVLHANTHACILHRRGCVLHAYILLFPACVFCMHAYTQLCKWKHLAVSDRCLHPAVFCMRTQVSSMHTPNCVLKPNSRTHYHVEVSGHKLESSQFLYGFHKLQGREYGLFIRFSSFFP
jgi:hypothetical protein